MATAAGAVARAQNRAVAKGSDPKAATCRAKLQRARSALNRQMDRELRLREGAENLLRATTKDGGSDNGSVIGGSGGCRNKNKNRKLIRQTVALELSFLESNVRLLADELAELNGSVDVYQHCDDDDVDGDYNDRDDFDGIDRRGPSTRGTADGTAVTNRQRRRQRQMPMIAVPLKDTRPIDFRLPLERFISQHYGIDLSAAQDDDGYDDAEDSNNYARRPRRPLSLRQAIDELTQLRLDTQTPSRDADGVRLLLRYYRQLYYVDRRFFPPSAVPTTTNLRQHNQNNHRQQPPQQQDNHYRHSKQVVTDTSITQPAIYFEWYDSFGGPVPSCGQRTVRFEQACVLFNVAAVHTQMGAKHDRRCSSGRDDDSGSGSGRPAGSWSTSTGPEPADGAAAAAQCFLRAAGAYRHIGDTFANAPARAADLRATGVLYAVMMAQANECYFEKLQWRLLASVRHRCRRYHGNGTGSCGRSGTLSVKANSEIGPGAERRGRSNRDATTRRTSTGIANGGNGDSDDTAHAPLSWTEMAREAAHVSRVYADVVFNSCHSGDSSDAQAIKENGGVATSVLPDAWLSVCRIKDRHYAALAYRYAACALLPYFRCSENRYGHRHGEVDSAGDVTDADDLLTELTSAAAAVGLEMVDDYDDDDDGDDGDRTSVAVQQRRRKQLGKLLLEAAAAAHDRAARVQRLCRQLRAKTDGNTSGGGGGGGGLLAGVLDRERQRTVRLLLLHRRAVNGDGDDTDSCCCDRRWCDDGEDKKSPHNIDVWHDCCSDDDDGVAATVADQYSGGSDQDEFTAAGITTIPGLDVDRGVLIRPWTRFRLMAIAPDFTDTGDGDYDDDDDDDDQRQNHGAVDVEERRADLFAGLGPVAVFSARHRCSRPRWLKLVAAGGHRSAGDAINAVAADDGDDDESTADPIKLVDRLFGIELRSHGGGTAAAVPPATVGHVRSNSQAQHVGLRRGDIVVALKCTSDDRTLDVRWDTCRRVAELIVQQYRQRRRRRQQSSGDGGNMAVVQLKVVTPITAASDSHSMTAMDPNQLHPRRRMTPARTTSHAIVSPTRLVPVPPSPMLLAQSTAKQQRRQRRPNANGSNDSVVDGSNNKMDSWSWNPFRRRRRSVVSNKS